MTWRAYRDDLEEFRTFTGIRTPIELRLITGAHAIAWRKDLDRRKLALLNANASGAGAWRVILA